MAFTAAMLGAALLMEPADQRGYLTEKPVIVDPADLITVG